MRPLRHPLARRLLRALPTAAIVVLFGLQIWQDRESARRRIGIDLETTAPELHILALQPGWPAERDGLAVGDRIVSVNGEVVDSVADYDRAAARFPLGQPIRYLIERQGGRLELSVRPGVPQAWSSLALNLALLAAYLAVAWLAGRQARTGDLRARLLELFAWAVAFEFALPSAVVGNVPVEVVAGALALLVNGLQFGIELHLASVLPDRQVWTLRHRWVIPGLYALGLAVGALAAITSAAETWLSVRALAWSSEQAQFLLYDVLFPVWALAVAGLLGVQALRHPLTRGRSQALLVLLGVSPWVLSILYSLVQRFVELPQADWLQNYPLLLLPYPVAIFVAVYRYGLLDVERVARRSLLYATLSAILLLVFYGALAGGGALFTALVGGDGASIWVISGATLLLGLLFSPLRQALQRLIDRRFVPERLAVRRRLVALASELPALGKLPRMGQHLVASLGEIFGVRSATLLLATPQGEHLVTLASTQINFEEQLDQSFLLSPEDPGVVAVKRGRRPLAVDQVAERSASFRQRLHALEAELVVPVMNHERLVGLLLLGAKSDRQPFTAEELELLSLLGHHVATVFENARLFESATYESLTGLLRRETILEQLERELARAQRYRRPLAIALADLDHFKSINDRFGHLAGDLMLKRAAQTLSLALRSTDYVGRFGGEEFLVILPETDLEGAHAVAEKLRQVIEDLAVESEDGEPLTVTVSIGLAATDELPDGRATPRDLIAAADRQLYDAKARGRNRVAPLAFAGA